MFNTRSCWLICQFVSNFNFLYGMLGPTCADSVVKPNQSMFGQFISMQFLFVLWAVQKSCMIVELVCCLFSANEQAVCVCNDDLTV